MFNARLRAERGALCLRHPNKRQDRAKVIVGSGWWSSEEKSEWDIGASVTRSTKFFSLWYRQVTQCIAPDWIVFTDSASPNKPDWGNYPLVKWIELDQNYGHANDIRTGKVKTKLCGWTRSVLTGAMYAYCCDADYFVYVEQDCLIRGENFLKIAIANNSADILFGARTEGGVGINGKSAVPMFQNSLIIVKKSGLERFICGILEAPESDGELSPEKKLERQCAPFGEIAVPYGRSRPIDFEKSHFYAQHLTNEELKQFVKSEGLPRLESVEVKSIFDI